MKGLFQRLAQNHAGSGQQVLAPQANYRVQTQCVFRSLLLQVIVVSATHSRRSIVLR
jgi:hypothetical protein